MIVERSAVEEAIDAAWEKWRADGGQSEWLNNIVDAVLVVVSPRLSAAQRLAEQRRTRAKNLRRAVNRKDDQVRAMAARMEAMRAVVDAAVAWRNLSGDRASGDTFMEWAQAGYDLCAAVDRYLAANPPTPQENP